MARASQGGAGRAETSSMPITTATLGGAMGYKRTNTLLHAKLEKKHTKEVCLKRNLSMWLQIVEASH